MNDISTFNAAQTTDFKAICEKLEAEFIASLLGAESKLYHGSPAWFIDGNPIVGYYVPKKGDRVAVMFWSGQSFDEPGLRAEGSFKAAVVDYATLEDVDSEELQRWLEKSKSIQWDYKNIVKNGGQLNRLV